MHKLRAGTIFCVFHSAELSTVWKPPTCIHNKQWENSTCPGSNFVLFQDTVVLGISNFLAPLQPCSSEGPHLMWPKCKRKCQDLIKCMSLRVFTSRLHCWSTVFWQRLIYPLPPPREEGCKTAGAARVMCLWGFFFLWMKWIRLLWREWSLHCFLASPICLYLCVCVFSSMFYLYTLL